MAKQLITIGTPGAGGGDPAHVAFKKFNDNATELYDAAIPDSEAKKVQAHANLGLGTAATKNVGTAAGNVMEVGAFGLGGNSSYSPASDSINKNGFYHEQNGAGTGSNMNYKAFVHIQHYANPNYALQIGVGMGDSTLSNLVGRIKSNGVWSNNFKIYNSSNASADSNGFIKAASPIVQLYSDKIDINDEGQLQDITFEKLGVGDYLVKGSLGFAQIGWYIEMPKDANGNVLVAVVYEQLENNDISVKTYAKKFDDETGDIVANLTKPRDIPAGRWIDIRLQELPQPEVQISESNTPPDFQPTNLAQAVAEALNNDAE